MLTKISSMLDAVADSLEAQGLIKEAYEIDKIADAIDSQKMKKYIKLFWRGGFNPRAWEHHDYEDTSMETIRKDYTNFKGKDLIVALEASKGESNLDPNFRTAFLEAAEALKKESPQFVDALAKTFAQEIFAKNLDKPYTSPTSLGMRLEQKKTLPEYLKDQKEWLKSYQNYYRSPEPVERWDRPGWEGR